MAIHTLIQHAVDVMIIVMAGLLAICTLALIVVHFCTDIRYNTVRRLREQILRMINVNARIEYMRVRIYDLLNTENDVRSLRSVHGIRSVRGLQVLETVSHEVKGERLRILCAAVADDWFIGYLEEKLVCRHKDTAMIAVKLVSQLQMPGYEPQIEASMRRWPADADVQQICLLSFFLRGQDDDLIRLFVDKSFHVILSFRTLQELFSLYSGDHASLFAALLPAAIDPYVKRCCIRGIGLEGYTQLASAVEPFLASDLFSLQLEAVRALGRLGDKKACSQLRKFIKSDVWAMRCAAVEALYAIEGEKSYETIRKCITDKEWWVRLRTAEILIKFADRKQVSADVEACGDRYALDMLRYMIEREAILKQGEATA